jgi:hypothetical protein
LPLVQVAVMELPLLESNVVKDLSYLSKLETLSKEEHQHVTQLLQEHVHDGMLQVCSGMLP